MKTKPLLGQFLIEKEIIAPQQLELALAQQQDTRELLGDILLRLQFVEPLVLGINLAEHFGIEFYNLKDGAADPVAVKKIPAAVAHFYKVLAVREKDGFLNVVTSRPFALEGIDAVQRLTGLAVKIAYADDKEIQEALKKYYGFGAAIVETIVANEKTALFVAAHCDEKSVSAEHSVARFTEMLLTQAYQERATDIHLEPFEKKLQIRFRIDGILYDVPLPADIQPLGEYINSRIKILANLDIAQRRLPQDGRLKLRVGDLDLDLRVSFLPTPNGESVVVRILSSRQLYSLAQLGLAATDQAQLEQTIRKPHGIIFVSGPTGSGKTTTLYSCLWQLNREDRKIITIEDPIEYELSGITQIQIHPVVGLSFAAGLRSMLRHDPDIMMVGEVRDKETAEIAMQAAMTGHLVFSTLHTNDAVSGISRLMDIGVEPYLIADSVECFVAQRLVRLVCPHCRRQKRFMPEKNQLLFPGIKDADDFLYFEGAGCSHCRHTGYYGRQAIYEFFYLTDELRNLISRRIGLAEIRRYAVSHGMRTLGEAGWEKVRQGLTTPAEVFRVLGQDENPAKVNEELGV